MNDREASEVAQVHRRHHALGVQATDVASPSSAAGWLAGAESPWLREAPSSLRPHRTVPQVRPALVTAALRTHP